MTIPTRVGFEVLPCNTGEQLSGGNMNLRDSSLQHWTRMKVDNSTRNNFSSNTACVYGHW